MLARIEMLDKRVKLCKLEKNAREQEEDEQNTKM